MNKPVMLTGLTSIFLSILSPSAATAEEGAYTLEEIVVTAQKRSQNLQDVAMGITAFSGLEMERAGDTSFEDFAVRVPNLSFGATGDGGIRTRSIAIRGIFGVGTTGFYIDDTPMEESMSPLVLDLERVEVLRGPQGTLYGARSMGGTVRFITKQPDLSEMEVKGHLGTSNTKEGGWNYQIDASINLPLVEDRLALRLMGYYQYDEGIFDRVHSDYTPGPTFATPDFASQENVDDFDVSGVQAALKFAVNDRLTLNARLNYQKSTLGSLPLADNEPGNYINARAFDVREFSEDEWVHASIGFNADLGVGSLVGVFAHWDRVAQDTEDMSELVSWLGFLAGIPTFIPPLEADMLKKGKVNGEVAELRFASEFDSPFQVVVGGFYSNTYSGSDIISIVPGLSDGFDNLVGAPLGTDAFGVANVLFSQDDDNDIKEVALFGEASFDITDVLKVTAGLRWFETKIDSDLVLGGFAGGPTGPGSTKENGINPKFAVEYSYSENGLIYASAAKGFRRGGVNSTPVDFCGASLEAFGVDPEAADGYDSDTLWSYEVGAKTTLNNNRVQLNVAAFWIDWNNIQQVIVLDCGFGFLLNSGGARSRGVEIETSIAVTDGLVIDASLGYTDAEITAAGLLETPISVPGAPIQHVPEWTFSTSAEYTFPLNDDLEGRLRLDYSYIGKSVSFINHVPGEGTPPTTRKAVNLLNLRVSVILDDWEVSVFADNLLNEITSYGDNRSLAVETPGRPRLAQNRPRTVGIETRFRF